jgi:hypothetical protein
MGDEREFKIKITTSADASGARQTAAELDKLGGAQQSATKATEEGIEATGKATLSHRELHMALAQLGPEFAHLGGMAQYAMHSQVLGPVLGIVGAFALWQHRVEACVAALGGVELPDNIKSQVGQISALATSWNTFNKALMDAATEYGSVDQASKRNLEVLKAEEEQKKKLLEADKKLALSELERQKTSLSTAEYEERKAAIEEESAAKATEDDDEARVKKLAAKAHQGAELVKSAKEKMAAAAQIHLGTPEQEGAIDENMKQQAEAAEKSAKERQDRLKDLFEHKDKLGNPMEQLAREARLIGRYGLLGTAGAGMEDAIAMEKAGGAGEQTVIERYRQRMAGKSARGLAEEERKKLVSDAGKEAGEAFKIWQEGPGDAAAYNRRIDNRHAVDATDAATKRNLADAKMFESPEGKLLSNVAMAEHTLQQGGQISVMQQSQIATVAAQMTAAHIAHGQEILKQLAWNRDAILKLMKQLKAMAPGS